MIIDLGDLDKCDIKTVRYESDREGIDNITTLIADFNSGKNRFDRPGEKLLGFILDNKIVGVCALGIDAANARHGRLQRLFVLRRFRHRGIGSKLVKYLVKHAAGHFDALVVSVEGHDPARFYEELGFKPAKDHPAYTHFHPTAGAPAG
jgi:GNAT superfamily N-acetyltransferase